MVPSSLPEIRPCCWVKDNNKHYVTLYIVCEYESGEPEIKEPDKCEAWEWFSWIWSGNGTFNSEPFEWFVQFLGLSQVS